MNAGDNFVIDEVEYLISSEKDSRVALVTASLKIRSDCKMIILGSLRVDGHELLPSFRLTLESGENVASLRSIKIVRPLPPPSLYRMEIRLSADGFSYKSDTREIAIELK